MTFTELAWEATGHKHEPYPYQLRLADEGLPDLLCVPTGAGKTLAETLPWVYRRRFHPDVAVRRATPRRLVLVLPQRSLVEQTHRVVTGWLEKLPLDPAIGVHLLLGGASTDDRLWKMHPASDAVLIGTQDMVLSRLLLRGYGESRANWPISFGLLHSDSQFVFDEVQLMGPALPTSLQLEGLRAALGTAMPSRSMWMSATVDRERFDTPDFAGIGTVVELSDADRTGALGRRLDATRTVSRLDVDPKRHAGNLAAAVLDRHRPGTRTIVVANTVNRATEVYDALRKSRPAADVVLLHSRFRPRDRVERMTEVTDTPGPAGTIVVSTQVLEAGVDLDSRLLLTEVAPWSSIVQRAGRCNRSGDHADAQLLWTEPPPGRNSAAPYDDKDLARAAEALTALEGLAVTTTALQRRAVAEERPVHPVLRRRDLVDLFDTAPDLSGNDLDVTRWIRDADEVTASVAWRVDGDDGPPADAPAPGRAELCPAPLADLRDRVKLGGAWVFDQTESRWRRAERDDVRPGAIVVLAAARGGYTADRGWWPENREPVDPVTPEVTVPPDGLAADPLSLVSRWVTLAEHLEDVRRETATLLEAFDSTPGVTEAQRQAAELAGLYHDLGKVHDVFAESLRKLGGEPGPGPWAKSGHSGGLRHGRKAFRHELVSALMVLDPASGLLDGVEEPDLVAYLVAAHHGKVRLAARSVPGEENDRLLGVERDDHVDPVTLPDGREIPALALRREVFELGSTALGDSWQARTCRLRDRADLGPFRLGFLEAVVRMADWRASESYKRNAS